MKKSFFFLSIFSLFSSLGAHSPQWSLDSKEEGWNSMYFVQKYFHHSECQRQWAWQLLGKQSWKGDEIVLDFGCGDGKISAELARLVHQGKVVGVDVSEKMIGFAQFKFPNSQFNNLEFKTLHSMNASGLESVKQFDVACAFCVLHMVSDVQTTLKHLKAALKPQGKLLLVVPAGRNPALFSAAEQTFAKYGLTAPWSKVTAPAISIRTLDGCKQILEEAGFHGISIAMNSRPTPFFDKEELIQWMVGNTSANWNVPSSIAVSFFQDVVEKMCELDPEIIDEQGHVMLKLSRLEVTAFAQ